MGTCPTAARVTRPLLELENEPAFDLNKAGAVRREPAGGWASTQRRCDTNLLSVAHDLHGMANQP